MKSIQIAPSLLFLTVFLIFPRYFIFIYFPIHNLIYLFIYLLSFGRAFVFVIFPLVHFFSRLHGYCLVGNIMEVRFYFFFVSFFLSFIFSFFASFFFSFFFFPFCSWSPVEHYGMSDREYNHHSYANEQCFKQNWFLARLPHFTVITQAGSRQ